MIDLKTKDLLLGLDLGTTSLKALLWNAGSGKVERTLVVDYPSVTEDSLHEQNPAHWFNALKKATTQLFQVVDPNTIAAIGLSGHMHALVLLDKNNAPVRPATTWADRRATSQAAALNQNNNFLSRSLNQPVEAFTAPRLAWLVENEPDSVARAKVLLGAKDYLGYLLTDEIATDPSDAMGTLLWDPGTRQWDEELFLLCGASVKLGAPVIESVAKRGAITARASEQTGIRQGTPVFCGAGDVSSVVVGSGVMESSTVCLNAGTAAQAMRLTDSSSFRAGFLFHPALGAGMVAMSASYAAGASFAWANATLGENANIWAQNAHQKKGGSGMTYLPYMMGSAAPQKNDAVRGAFLGQNPSHTSTDMAAAVLEGIAFSCADSIDQVAALGNAPESLILVGGVSNSARWREVIANTLQMSVYHLPSGGSALGAAAIAGVGSGMVDLWDLPGVIQQSAVSVQPTALQSDDRVSRDRFRHFSNLLINAPSYLG